MTKLPITVAVCTYNEEKHIVGCLESVIANDPAQIVVIDGGSSDCTVKLARDYLFAARREGSVRVWITTNHHGLASQRQCALNLTDQPHHMIVDAHHRLIKGCLAMLLREMQEGDWDALQTMEAQLYTKSYWTIARANANREITYVGCPRSTNMVGRPALYRTSALRQCGGFDSDFDGVGDEDTDVSIRMQMHGYKQGIGTGVAFRVDELTFRSMLRKFVKYGRGDARIIKKYPWKKWAIVKHLLWRYPWERGLRDLKYWPYYALCGWVRFGAMVWEKVRAHDQAP